MIAWLLFYCFISFCSAFAIGRLGHIYMGAADGPDHWIYGVVLFAPGIFVVNSFIFLLFAFGLGLIISDLKDFVMLKSWGPDKVEILRFWHID